MITKAKILKMQSRNLNHVHAVTYKDNTKNPSHMAFFNEDFELVLSSSNYFVNQRAKFRAAIQIDIYSN